jgi:hypothetical protein
MVEIPIRTNNNQAMSVTLDNRVYEFDFIWNARTQLMNMNLYYQDEPVLLGVAMVIDWPLIGQYRKTEGPQGELLLINIEDLQQPSLNDFSDKARLIYLSEDEVPGFFT